MLLAFAVTSAPLAKQSTVCRKQRVPNPLTPSAQEGVGQHMGKALAEGSAPTLLSRAELWNHLSLLCQAVALGWQLQGRETPCSFPHSWCQLQGGGVTAEGRGLWGLPSPGGSLAHRHCWEGTRAHRAHPDPAQPLPTWAGSGSPQSPCCPCCPCSVWSKALPL